MIEKVNENKIFTRKIFKIFENYRLEINKKNISYSFDFYNDNNLIKELGLHDVTYHDKQGLINYELSKIFGINEENIEYYSYIGDQITITFRKSIKNKNFKVIITLRKDDFNIYVYHIKNGKAVNIQKIKIDYDTTIEEVNQKIDKIIESFSTSAGAGI